MTISNLTVSAPSGSTNTLSVSDIGTALPLTILNTLSVSNGGVLLISNSAVSVSGITNGNFDLGGSLQLQNGSLSVSNVLACGQGPGATGSLAVVNGTGSFSGTLCVGLDTNAMGGVLLTNGQLTLTNGPAVVGFCSTGQATVVNGSTLASDRAVIVGLGAGSQGSFTLDSSLWIAGEHVIVGEYFGATGVVSITSGQLAVTNVSLTLVGGAGSGQLVWSNSAVTVGMVEVAADRGSQGTLTMAGGSAEIQGLLSIGYGLGSTGVLWMTDGQLIATNWPILIGYWGNGTVNISNGNWLGNSMLLALHAVQATNAPGPPSLTVTGELSRAMLNINGGSVMLLSKLVVGNCTSGGVGVVNVNGGNLFVTNAAHTAFIDVRNGQLNLNGGLLQTDILVMTNRCGLLVPGGGTLVAGSVVLATNTDADGDGILNGWEQAYGLDPLNPADASADNDGDGLSNLQEFLAGTSPTNSASAFRIVSITRTGSDVNITWTTAGGRTNIVQAAADLGGSYSNISANIIIAGSGDAVTNYVHVGGATNTQARYYRIRLVP